MNPELGAALVLDDVINRYLACYNARDIDGMLDCVTEDVVFENISNTGQSMRLDGRDMMRQVAELSGNAFSYRRQRSTLSVEAARLRPRSNLKARPP